MLILLIVIFKSSRHRVLNANVNFANSCYEKLELLVENTVFVSDKYQKNEFGEMLDM